MNNKTGLGQRSDRIPLITLLNDIRACDLCASELSLGPRPVLRASVSARLLIVGQAPGTRVHASGIPWDDPSGERLRAWLAMDKPQFYDERQIAIVPMGFCYPGKGKSGDLPPRAECAPLCHERVLEHMPEIELVLLIGAYAQAHYLGASRETLTERVRRWRDFGPRFLPLPHPSPRNTLWLKRNPWFEDEVVPELRRRVAALLGNQKR
ncbi:MAG: uracil-DNA glycosylase family protein [Pseudomonadota bacterium]